MGVFEEIAVTLNIQFPSIVMLSVYTMFFLSLYILSKRVKGVYLLAMILSPLFLFHLIRLENISLSFQLFVFSIALYLLERNKPLHSAFISILLCFLEPSSFAGVSLLFLSRYIQEKRINLLFFAIILMLFLPFSSTYKISYYALIPSLAIPYLISFGGIFFIISLIFSIFPSSMFFFIYDLSKRKPKTENFLFSIVIFSFILSSINIYAISLLLITLFYMLNLKEDIFKKKYNAIIYLLVFISISLSLISKQGVMVI